MKTAHKWIKEAPRPIKLVFSSSILNKYRYKEYDTFSLCLVSAFDWSDPSIINLDMHMIYNAALCAERI